MSLYSAVFAFQKVLMAPSWVSDEGIFPRTEYAKVKPWLPYGMRYFPRKKPCEPQKQHYHLLLTCFFFLLPFLAFCCLTNFQCSAVRQESLRVPCATISSVLQPPPRPSVWVPPSFFTRCQSFPQQPFYDSYFFLLPFRFSICLLALANIFFTLHFFLFFLLVSCLPLSIGLNLNWELQTQNGASGSEPFTRLHLRSCI